MTFRRAEQWIAEKLIAIYTPSEAAAIADRVMENLTEMSRSQRSFSAQQVLAEDKVVKLGEWLPRLLAHEPVQYVLQEGYFYDMPFYVNRDVLIPRPETEELVEWIIREQGARIEYFDIVDVGTGSGCIPVTLAKKLPRARVLSCDISDGALAVAAKNAEKNGVGIQLLRLNFLDSKEWSRLPETDILVSNPPYIPSRERETLDRNVANFEPAVALFVPDDDALVFYDALARFAKEKLKAGGAVYAELHESLSRATEALFRGYGFDVVIKTDMQGKQRMIKAVDGKDALERDVV